jgi:hypothetical protein
VYDATSRVYSVGMVVCKSNMAELADNIKFAIENDVGLNLSPVVIYPVTEQLNVFSDFSKQTKGWRRAIAKAKDLVITAKLRERPAIARVDPEGMLGEIERIFIAAKDDYSDTMPIVCEIDDSHHSLGRMRRPTIIAYIAGEAHAYVQLAPGMREGVLRVPRKYLNGEKTVRLDFVHDVMEPASNLSSGSFKIEKSSYLNVNYRIPEFAEVHRPRNINWASYGDTTPDGHHIINPVEIFEIYRELYSKEFATTAIATAGYQRRSLGLMKQLVRYVRR